MGIWDFIKYNLLIYLKFFIIKENFLKNKTNKWFWEEQESQWY